MNMNLRTPYRYYIDEMEGNIFGPRFEDGISRIDRERRGSFLMGFMIMSYLAIFLSVVSISLWTFSGMNTLLAVPLAPALIAFSCFYLYKRTDIL